VTRREGDPNQDLLLQEYPGIRIGSQSGPCPENPGIFPLIPNGC